MAQAIPLQIRNRRQPWRPRCAAVDLQKSGWKRMQAAIDRMMNIWKKPCIGSSNRIERDQIGEIWRLRRASVPDCPSLQLDAVPTPGTMRSTHPSMARNVSAALVGFLSLFTEPLFGQTWIPLVDFEQVWRYETSGMDLGTAWRT